MILALIKLICGIIFLYLGAEYLVRGSSVLARRLGISPLVVGLTIIAFGTSAPELLVSIKSAFTGHAGIALGNVIGSNIFNIAMVLGISAMLCPIHTTRQVINR